MNFFGVFIENFDRCLVNDKIILNGYLINILNLKLIFGFFRFRKEY